MLGVSLKNNQQQIIKITKHGSGKNVSKVNSNKIIARLLGTSEYFAKIGPLLYTLHYYNKGYQNSTTLPILKALGTIHLRRRHHLGGKGSKICQICQRIVVNIC